MHVFRDKHCRYWRNLVVDPSSDGYYWWLAVISIAVLYNLLVIIARAVFWQLQDAAGLSVWLSLDYVCDAIYLADMFVQFRTGRSEKIRHILKVNLIYDMW
jgi:hypothetical protein